LLVVQKDSEEAKQALDQLKELGWAKRWSSQPYMSRRTVSGWLAAIRLLIHHDL
jgi:hypothetical protein